MSEIWVYYSGTMVNNDGPVVAKFGGTSVSSKEGISNICDIVASQSGRQSVVVVSALTGVTDLLLSLLILPKLKAKKELTGLKNMHKNLAQQVLKDAKLQKEVTQFTDSKIDEVAQYITGSKIFNKAFLDRLASFGEIMSSYIITSALLERGINASQVVSTNLIITNDNFGGAEFFLEPTRRKIKENLVPLIKKGIVPVVTGYIGATKYGEITTLGRGGSDYTASIIGFCIGAKEIQIWTDVDGMFTCDPRLVKNARPLPVVSFKEASELATFGARVLHPRTISPAISANIPVRVLNTFNPKGQGTFIIEKTKFLPPLRAISFKRKIVLINISSENMLLQKGFLAKVFTILARHNISIDLVSVSEVSLSLTLDNDENLDIASRQISEFATVSVNRDCSMISLIGEGIADSTATIRKIFDILDREKIAVRMISFGATNINISLVVKNEQMEKAVKLLHDRLIL